MRWIAPTEKDLASTTLEKRLWDAADQFRANSGLKPQEYSGPILGLIFLRFAEVRYAAQRAKLEQAWAKKSRGAWGLARDPFMMTARMRSSLRAVSRIRSSICCSVRMKEV